jgi:hypothetical protein
LLWELLVCNFWWAFTLDQKTTFYTNRFWLSAFTPNRINLRSGLWFYYSAD